ncbi:hypothetical protein PV326_002249, partial [Microctonus aethiopoides]
MEKSRAIIFDSKSDKNLWGEANKVIVSRDVIFEENIHVRIKEIDKTNIPIKIRTIIENTDSDNETEGVDIEEQEMGELNTTENNEQLVFRLGEGETATKSGRKDAGS